MEKDIWTLISDNYFDPPRPKLKEPAKPSKPLWKELQSKKDFLADIEEYDRRVNQYQQELEKFQNEINIWKKLCSEREKEFQTICFQVLGILNHPKSQMLFNIAWDEAYSEGRWEVYHLMEKLVPLIKD